MELKEMADTGVIINTESELDEYLQICEDGGWRWMGGDLPTQWSFLSFESLPRGLNACNHFGQSRVSHYRNKITLAQFKERNGIMKYKQGDVLESSRSNVDYTVQGVVGCVYIVTAGDHKIAQVYSENELNSHGYTLKTDEPEMVELTLEDVAKLKGIPVEILRIKD